MGKAKSWKLISSKNVSVGEWFPIEERRYEKANGERVDFTVTILEDVAMVIPVTREKKIVMVKQFKPGSGKVTLEFPAGRKKAHDQSYEEAARAELREETGMEVKELISLGETITFPTKGTERVGHFLGIDAVQMGEQQLDKDEDIEVVEFEFEEIERMILEGTIDTGPSITCWYLAKVKRIGLFAR